MLLLPVGQENSEIRRHPLVFWALLALNLLCFFAVVLPFSTEDWATAVRRRAQAVSAYYGEHPYLRVPSSLMVQMPPEVLSQLSSVRAAALARGDAPIPSVAREEQERLARLAGELLDAVRKTPAHRWGYVPAEPAASTLLTYMFLHGGWLHILGNLLFLYLTAPFVEDLYGRPLFAALYLAGGVVAALVHAWQHPHLQTPLVGASGAIAAVMGAFLVRLGRARIEFLFLPVVILPWIRFRFFLPAFVFLPLWLLEQLWYARREGLAPGVAWWAHVGGFAFGVAAALLLKATRVEERWVNPSIESSISFVQDPALLRASEARRAEDYATAEREIAPLLARDPEGLDAAAEAYEIAASAGDLPLAGRRAAHLLDLYRRKGEKELLHSLLADAPGRVGAGLPPRFLAAGAAFLEEEGYAEAALDLYERLADAHPADAAALRALLKASALHQREGRLADARRMLDRAAAHPEAQGAFRKEIEKRLQAL